MKNGVCVSLGAVMGVCSVTVFATAALANPLVIPGVGPQTGSQTSYAAPAPGRRVIVARSDRAQRAYGCGFIEFLMTGSTPASSQGAGYNRPIAEPLPRAYPLPSPYPSVPAHGLGADYVALPAPEMSMNRAVDRQFMRQEVAYSGGHGPGTIIIDTPNRFLYLVTAPGRATRYGIGVGRPGFEWAGVKAITRKAEWPDWRPPQEMLKRRPDLPAFMAGGPDNPLGARALYLGSSLYRIHGTNEPGTIGQNVSSGCIRMMNEDVIDLYNRVRVGAKVVVR